MHNFLRSFDHNVAALVASLPEGIKPLMVLASFLGEPLTVISISLVVGVIAFLRGHKNIAKAEALGLIFFGINTAIKLAVHRTRPETIYAQSMKIKSYSFPSGHAFGSLFFYGLLAYIALTRLPQPYNYFVAVLTTALIILIGTSRVYLGAHFPSDVLAGWVFAIFCLALTIKLYKL